MAAGLGAAIEATPPQPVQQTPGQEYRSARLLERQRIQLFQNFATSFNASSLTVVVTTPALVIGPVRAHQRYRCRVLSGQVTLAVAQQASVSLQSVALIDPRSNPPGTVGLTAGLTYIPGRISGFTALAQAQGFAVDDFTLDSDDQILLAGTIGIPVPQANFLAQISVVVNNAAAVAPAANITWLLEVERFLYDGIFQPTP